MRRLLDRMSGWGMNVVNILTLMRSLEFDKLRVGVFG
jgi:hypothetical protein